MIASSLLGVTGAILIYASAGHIVFYMAVLAFFIMMTQASFNDLLCEGAYTRRMAEKPETGAALTSYVWLCSCLGSLLAAVWVGPIIDYVSFRVVLIPFLFLTSQQLFATAWPWPFKKWREHGGLLQEQYVPVGSRIMTEKFRQHRRLFICAIVLSLLAVGSVVAGLFNDDQQIIGFTYALFAGFSMVGMLWFTLPLMLFKPILYLFLSRFLLPNISSQVTYWLRSGPDCVERGPNFSWTFLLTLTSILQAIFGFVGVMLFQKFVSKWSFRKAFWITSLLTCLTSVFDVIMIYRWNIDYLGIPDKVWYFCSAAIIEEVISMWAFMPSCVLISRLCPRQVESTMYAVVAGVNNFGSSLAKYMGNFLSVYLLGIKTMNDERGSCNFDNLGLAVIIGSGLCPLLPLALTFFLVPNVGMDVHFGDASFEETNETSDYPIQLTAGQRTGQASENSENQESLFSHQRSIADGKPDGVSDSGQYDQMEPDPHKENEELLENDAPPQQPQLSRMQTMASSEADHVDSQPGISVASFRAAPE
ncbi:putative folate/methotrexate transporter FT1 [Neospora caninum Liverpool]|uniref:Folate/methotrexate transporter FT1, putative n=1 Tax=Neospora caninum (strain Liverpool) TaxID=572307 RepID=F0VM45_NEOCL|nr:putative folate/methotrexate transporter FT1 [Neospora caninum Liverpool]CBZ54323.1 putative folate/methotrexate transporter FT1 [Neospora caninum Liverpool]CEL69028.1 TPA: folate/methotrexate transporter FT1, putative [Neospora caninum Liverpool]|eukprot:XP_003884354.1 putative folate/methotrexate transporter FT1 [Neospora caninum Liverpool]